MKKFLFLFLILSLFRIQLFFGFNYIVEGYNINIEQTGGMSFKIIMTTSFLLLISIFFIRTFYFSRIKKFLIYFGIVLALNILLHSLFVMTESKLVFLSKDLLYFLILSLPGLFVIDFFYSICIDWRTKLSIIQNILICFLLIGDIFYLDFLNNLSPTRYLYTFGNLDYQATSYFFSLIFGFFIVRLKNGFNLLFLLCVINSIILVFFAGGKGAFLLIIVYLFLNYYKSLLNIKYLSVFLILILLFSQIYLNLNESTMGIQRISVLFDREAGYSEISSGRDEVHNNIIYTISNNLIFGVGPFSNYQLGYQPHNLALDFILRYGLVVGLGGLIWFLFYVSKLLINYPHIDFLTKWFLPYILVMSLFSGSLFVNEYLFVCFCSIFYTREIRPVSVNIS